jgi:hypothetical protein
MLMPSSSFSLFCLFIAHDLVNLRLDSSKIIIIIETTEIILPVPCVPVTTRATSIMTLSGRNIRRTIIRRGVINRICFLPERYGNDETLDRCTAWMGHYGSSTPVWTIYIRIRLDPLSKRVDGNKYPDVSTPIATPRPITTASCHHPELSTRLPPLDLKRNHVPHPCSNLCLIIDLAGKSRAPTSVAQAKLFVEILGNHYPERLGSVSQRLLVHVYGD